MADQDVAIKIDSLEKSFRLPHEKTSSVKSAVINVFSGNKSYETQHVLKGVSFEVKPGEFFGILGRNGSGKSTLLKLLAGIYSPDKGSVRVSGRLTPFIELGVGFSPELTGRENVFLNGALLGLSRKEMTALYDDIVAFAELEKFMDQKLKNYSSGMQVRLAFSIAIRVQSDILVLDEVLAVGDESFQRKCLDVFEDYKRKNKTIILVTHDMATVSKYCTRALLLDQGKIVSIGKPSSVANEYSELNQKDIDAYTDQINQKNQTEAEHPLKIQTKNADGNAATSFKGDEKMTITLSWPKELAVQNAGVALLKSTGEYIFATNTLSNKDFKVSSNEIDYTITLRLLPGKYYVRAALFGASDADKLDYIDEGPSFTVKKTDQNWEGLTYFDHDWSTKRSTKKKVDK